MRATSFFNPGRLMLIGGAALIACIVLLINADLSFPLSVPAPSPASVMPASPEIEAAWGIKIEHLALIGGGGMVDLRYTVIDPDRAAALLVSLDALPVITNVRSGGTLRLTESLHHRVNLDAGRTYYLLYANAGTILHKGDTVSLKVGDFTLEPVPVR